MSFRHILVFWGVLFLLIQQAERLFLLPEVTSVEAPTTSLLLKTLVAGLLADFVTTIGGIGVAAFLAVPFSLPFAVFSKPEGTNRIAPAYRRGLMVVLALVAVFLLAVSTADISYYGYNHQHLDFVFFEYVDELLHPGQQETTSQAAEQTSAELEDAGKWIVRIGGFLAIEAIAITAWCIGFIRGVTPFLIRWEVQRPLFMTVFLAVTVGGGAAGLSPHGLSLAHVIPIESETYYSLAQNPILFAQEPLRDAFLSQWTWAPARLPQSMTMDEAVETTQAVLGRGARFPFGQYPLVKERHEAGSVHSNRPVNVVLIFVEGLDRRYLGREISLTGSGHNMSGVAGTVRTTPFLDRLKDDSVYFEHFFSNGVQTTRGLFATLCSAFPRQGTAVIKTRMAHDYLCLPSLLRRAGFRTEMVVSLDSDLSGLRPFLERNGLDHFYSEQDFPAHAERLGVGLTDGALFDFLRARIETLQAGKAPFFLATMTSGTHHPFTVPLRHPDVRVLQQQPDQYLSALRYFDLEFERFFTELQRNGLLKNTMVLVLGDHGRHEPVGRTDVERQAGHFLTPLFIWLDDSLRSADTYRPHTVDRIASQVDVTPTILAMNGLTPRLSPFVGQDLSCLLISDCLHNNLAYLTSVYDDLIGVADQRGLWLYSFRRDSLTFVDLALSRPATHPLPSDPDVALHYSHMLAFYLTSNQLLEQDRIWSWKELGGKL